MISGFHTAWLTLFKIYLHVNWLSYPPIGIVIVLYLNLTCKHCCAWIS
uniref:Uncharacterized protein n=1 Tax=Rhizophora mucronata TaxID=61149 RepID=A0A2P2PUP8_RHIMU